MSTISSGTLAVATTTIVEPSATKKEAIPSRCERITASIWSLGSTVYQVGEVVASYTVIVGCGILNYCFDLVDQKKALQHIHDVWQEKIANHTIYHVTNALFAAHYTKNGLTAPLPKPFIEDMLAVQAIWKKYAKCFPSMVRDYYAPFSDYCTALQSKQQLLLWSSDAQGKAAWHTALDLLVAAVEPLEKKFSKEEHTILSRMRELTYLLSAMPVTTFSRSLIDAVTHAHDTAEGKSALRVLCMPEETFTQYVQQRCTEWRRPGKIKRYLKEHLEPQIEQARQLLHRSGIYLAAPCKNEAVTVVQSKKRVARSEESDQFLVTGMKLKLNEPCELTYEELESLKIRSHGFSLHTYFVGNTFDCKPTQTRHRFRVTRRQQTCTEQALYVRWTASLETQSKIRKKWLQLFKCEDTAQRYGVRPSELYDDTFSLKHF